MNIFPKLAAGEIMFSFAITEPNAGSDAAGIKTKAFFDERALRDQRRQDVYYRRGSVAIYGDFRPNSRITNMTVSLLLSSTHHLEGYSAKSHQEARLSRLQHL
ncbi:MAG: hypothetical protein MZV70_38100 [Desulfobacterales bacterium]|nr:hypothetical protein [Desulfobacterales bacterium]